MVAVYHVQYTMNVLLRYDGWEPENVSDGGFKFATY